MTRAPRNTTMTKDQDLIAAFLAKKGVTVVDPARAYGVNPEADKAEAKAKRAVERREARAKSKPVKRNWAAQRAYDEEWGTENGYDARIEAHRREQ